MANYTPNYKLHQWEPTDNFLRTDFNEDFAKIDTALAGKLDVSAQQALETQISTAQTALESQISERAKVAAGTYTGNGGTTTIKVGFKPVYVWVINAGITVYGCATAGTGMTGLSITSNGFQAVYSNTSVNQSGSTYFYVAIG